MKIAIPTSEGKLCAHFGHCETISFAEIDLNTKEILSLITDAPTEGISCQSASWIAQQGASLVLAGGMGGRPLMMFEQLGVDVITGCPELDIKEILSLFLNNELIPGDNSCGHDANHICHGHGEHHCHY